MPVGRRAGQPPPRTPSPPPHLRPPAPSPLSSTVRPSHHVPDHVLVGRVGRAEDGKDALRGGVHLVVGAALPPAARRPPRPAAGGHTTRGRGGAGRGSAMGAEEREKRNRQPVHGGAARTCGDKAAARVRCYAGRHPGRHRYPPAPPNHRPPSPLTSPPPPPPHNQEAWSWERGGSVPEGRRPSRPPLAATTSPASLPSPLPTPFPPPPPPPSRPTPILIPSTFPCPPPHFHNAPVRVLRHLIPPPRNGTGGEPLHGRDGRLEGLPRAAEAPVRIPPPRPVHPQVDVNGRRQRQPHRRHGADVHLIGSDGGGEGHGRGDGSDGGGGKERHEAGDTHSHAPGGGGAFVRASGRAGGRGGAGRDGGAGGWAAVREEGDDGRVGSGLGRGGWDGGMGRGGASVGTG